MKRSRYPICFMSVTLLVLVMLTSGCSQPGERVAVSGAEADEVISQEPIDAKNIMLPGDVPLELVWIPQGSFLMGRYPGEQDSYSNEDPQLEVIIAEGFWLGKYPITQAQWQAVMGNNPSYFLGDNRPVELVSWDDIRGAGGYLEHLNSAHQGYNFRLPSEAEWEYAYRAGTTTRFYWGDDPNYTQIDDYAWHGGISGSETYDVGLKLPNAWGLHDMAGNVWEWCEDDYHSNYNGAPNDGSAWVDSPRATYRLVRGGSWLDSPDSCRAAGRNRGRPDNRGNFCGFRIVCDMD